MNTFELLGITPLHCNTRKLISALAMQRCSDYTFTFVSRHYGPIMVFWFLQEY